MRTRVLGVLLAMELLLQVTCANAAGPLTPLKVGNWSGGSFTNDRTGAFSHCAAGAPYKNGIYFIVVVTSRFQWGLGFSSKNWHLNQGEVIPMDLTFDGFRQYHVFAKVLSGQMAVVPMPDNSALINTFRRAGSMQVFAKGSLVPFDLTDTSVLLPALVDCVRQSMGQTTAPQAEPQTTQNGQEAAATPPPSPKPDTAPAGSSKETFGTGIMVSSDGDILTNAHVVEGCSKIEVKTSDGTLASRIVARDARNDLALIKADIKTAKFVALRSGVRLGEEVAAFGYPLAGLLSTSGNFTIGNITALTGITDDSRYIQISAPVQPGNSGGPLVDFNGNLVGVVSEKLDALKVMSATSGDIPQNVNFAIKASVAGTFLESNSISYATGNGTGNAMSPPDLATYAKSVSVFVDCK